MTISRERAERVATEFVSKMGYGSYSCCDVEFKNAVARRTELPFLAASPASWIVRFKNPTQQIGLTVDDGDALICIEVDADKGTATLLAGI